MIILPVFLGLQLLVHLQRRVLTFGVSEGGWQLGWGGGTLRSDIALQCGSVDPPAQVSVQSPVLGCARWEGPFFKDLQCLCQDFCTGGL